MYALTVEQKPRITIVRGVEVWLSPDVPDIEQLIIEFRTPYVDEGTNSQYRCFIEMMLEDAEAPLKRIEIYPFLVLGIYKARAQTMSMVIGVGRP